MFLPIMFRILQPGDACNICWVKGPLEGKMLEGNVLAVHLDAGIMIFEDVHEMAIFEINVNQNINRPVICEILNRRIIDDPTLRN